MATFFSTSALIFPIVRSQYCVYDTHRNRNSNLCFVNSPLISNYFTLQRPHYASQRLQWPQSQWSRRRQQFRTMISPSYTATSSPSLPRHHHHSSKPPPTNLTTTLTAIAATAILATASPPALADAPGYNIYYGTAASAANYGGFGGNSSKKDSAEYIYDVPEGWKERLVSKVQKGTNGTDSEFYNPKKRNEKEYLTFLSGFRQLAPKEAVLNNLALSDVVLQDLIASADNVKAEEKKDENGQEYYVYEIDGVGAHSLISVTCAKNKLYAHFVMAPTPEWNRDQETLRHVHESFKTIG